MRICNCFVVFSTFYILTSALNSNLVHENLLGDKKISNYVCEVTRNILNAKNDTQDVLVKNLDDQFWSSEANDIAGCIKDVGAVIVSDFDHILTKNTLRKAAVVILMLKYLKAESASMLFYQHRNSVEEKDVVFHYKAKFIVIVPGNTQKTLIHNLLREFMDFGFIDVACVKVTESGLILVYNIRSLSRSISLNHNPLNPNIIFPDKLKNMERHPYRVALYSQIPRIIIFRGKLITPLKYFMTMMENIQNATVEYSFSSFKDIHHRWNTRKMDLTFNTGLVMLTNETEFMTYEENYYCAIIPLPPKIPLFYIIFIKPYDSLTWIFFIITIIASFFVLLIFRNRGAVDSPFLLGFGIFVIFIGQGVEFSRKNRLVLTIMIQLIIVMVWVLSNAYEGVITSFMIQPIDDKRLKTFNDLINSDFKIITSDGVAEKMKLSEAYTLLKPRLNTSGPHLGDHFRVELQRARFVFIMNCDEIEILVPYTIPQTTIKVSQLYYILPQKFYPAFLNLAASYLNPYLERLQYYMDLSFQAGLPYIWNVYASLESPFKKTSTDDFDSYDFLKLEDLIQVFSILIVGYTLSAILIIIEIFFHDVLQKLKLPNIVEKLKNQVYQNPQYVKHQKTKSHLLKRSKRLQPKKLNVRRIFVQPRVITHSE